MLTPRRRFLRSMGKSPCRGADRGPAHRGRQTMKDRNLLQISRNTVDLLTFCTDLHGPPNSNPWQYASWPIHAVRGAPEEVVATVKGEDSHSPPDESRAARCQRRSAHQ